MTSRVLGHPIAAAKVVVNLAPGLALGTLRQGLTLMARLPAPAGGAARRGREFLDHLTGQRLESADLQWLDGSPPASPTSEAPVTEAPVTVERAFAPAPKPTARLAFQPPAAVVAPDPAAPTLARDDLPIEDYDHLTIGSLRSRIRGLSADQLQMLHDYESAHGHRLPVLTALDNRLTRLTEQSAASATVG